MEREAEPLPERAVELEHTLQVDEAAVGSVLALAASHDMLFAATQRGFISVWDKTLFQPRQAPLEVGDRCPLSLAVMPRFDGGLLLCAPRGCIELWDMQSLSLRVRIVGFAGNIFSLVCINGRLFAGCQDTTIKSIDVEKLLARLPEPTLSQPHAVVTLAQLAQWAGVLVATSEHRGYVYALAATPCHHQYLVSGSGDGTVKVWKPETLECVATLAGHAGSVLSVAADTSFIYSGSQDKLVKVWDLETFYQTRSLMHGAEVMALAVSADHLISGTADSALKVWEKAQFACKQTIDHGSPVTTILVSGRTIFTACDTAVKVWTSGQPQHHRRRASALVTSGGSVPLPNGPDLEEAMLEALRVFVKLKTVSVDPAMKEQCWSGARFLRRLLRETGFECKLVQGAEGTNPLVLGRLGNDPTKPTLAFYGHYDVVPAAVEEGWASSDPFVMDGRDGFVYGRGVTDDKGPLLAFVFAVKQLLLDQAATGGKLPVNIVMAVEGEEENDSHGFVAAIENNLSWFEGTDVLLVSNGLWVGNRRPCLTYGLRGVVQLSLQVTGAKRDLHSGIDGGLMHEPMGDLVAVLGQLMDRTGTILVPGFYDAVQPVTDEEARLYEDEGFETQFSSLDFFTQKYGVARKEALLSASPKDLLMRRWRQPSLTIHSVSGSVLGKDTGATVIPHKVTAKLSVRIVPNQRPEEIFRTLAAFLEERFDALQSGNTLKITKDHIGDWWLGNPFSEHYKAAERAIERVWGVRPSYIREGGTIPITRFLEDKLGASAVHLPLGQASDAAHLPNERMRLENLLKGKLVFQHFICELATVGRSGHH